MQMKTSPLAPKALAVLPPIDGVRIGAAAAGIKYAGRTDLMAMMFDRPAAIAGVLTRSHCPSAPVDWCRANLLGGKARILVVNSGNANAFTGKRGADATALTAHMAATAAQCPVSEVFLSSTGVIGEPLAAERFDGVLQQLVHDAGPDRWEDAARAIMTTDTFPKLATRTVEIDGVTITLNGIAKGSGMIAPDMATMLAYVVTDAPVSAVVLQTLLGRHVDATFNAITVDSDTSTSDTVLAFAAGAADIAPIETADDPRLAAFEIAFKDLMEDLALQIVRDGEGASRLMRVEVTGAQSDGSARTIALAIANSPLVKTALAGGDANWGRIVMAVGKAGEPADRDRLDIRFGDLFAARDGERAPGYDEDAMSRYMQRDEITIGVDIGLGEGRFTAWGCDLTKDYVAINGDYRS
ncbi:MAG: bifunctional glutamate N-acetyltransferase/amino-acid acetyltransferase ArgJ [Roseitalea sp.]|nr:bifunctional glutamate N-acetyltransferase/amino-acid acetyltransferase ArgJ [Roseitalea sp.]MBO6722604.1 bifunctional glutamate N-acetyltransferase/amino-acid acetyltransferase ArgJ [Roseitalea sp.]MBO6745107.1 bifunctional glutamate N-acetyltransferase/amino-acid acetyltransferase ArgJ [Roseitalea sp.]